MARRGFIRRVVWGAVGVAGLIVAWNGRDIAAAGRFFYYERRAMAYALPAGTVILEGDPDEAKRLAATDPAYTLAPYSAVAIRTNDVWPGLAPHLVHIGGSGGGVGTTVFMHERRDEVGGATRLIVMTAWVVGSGSELQLKWACADPARGGRTFPKAYPTSMRIVQAGEGAFDVRELRLFAGQADPSDAARFTIPYRYGGEDGVIRGVVHNGSALVEIESGPLKSAG
jgi:hypothetical protein